MIGIRPLHAAILLAAALALSGALGAAGRAPEIRLPQDLTYGTAPDSPGPVTFSHKTHVEIADNKCLSCHPAPFKMLRPARKVTHADMEAGRLCGACHDGKSASGVQGDCEHCHKPKVAAAKGGGS